jgi:nucleotide-binding universal stress UspA family protein
MTIICGTDFSDNAREAASVAAALASRLDAPLKLVHVLDELGAELAVGSHQDAISEPVRARLREWAAELASRYSVEVEPVDVPGSAHEKLCDIARDSAARAIVVSSLGRRKQHRWLLGSVAERVAQSATVPVIVVRESAGLLAWCRGEVPLRVMVGVELGSTSRAALRWTGELRALGPCDVLVTRVTSPFSGYFPEARGERGELLEELRAWMPELPGEGELRLSVSPASGPVDHHLALVAAEAAVDLLVVGTHQRSASARLWQGSVSRGVLHHAPCNVACVPRSDPGQDDTLITSFRRVLVPTDLSPLANRAVAAGYGIVAPGGIVRLVHVAPEGGGDDAKVKDRLRALVRRQSLALEIATELDVVRSSNIPAAICASATEFDADAICMVTRSSTPLRTEPLAPTTQEVLRQAHRPVLLVPPEE